MNINLAIDNLILDEGVIMPTDKLVFIERVKTYLQEFLTNANTGASYSDNTITRLNAGAITLAPDSSTDVIAQRVAVSVFESINRELLS